MNWIRVHKADIEFWSGALALFCLLTYTLVHTGALLGTYIRPVAVGYIAATGIEVAVVSLSLRIGNLKKVGRDTAFFIAVLVAVVSVSALANMAEGHRVLYNAPFTVATFTNLDGIQAAVWFGSNGLISLVVMALSETIGSEVSTKVVASDSVPAPSESEVSADAPNISQPVENYSKPPKTIMPTSDLILNYISGVGEAGTTVKDIALGVGVSRATATKWVGRLVEQGVLSKNGKVKAIR